MKKLRVVTSEKTKEGWSPVLVHTFMGKDRKQAIAFHRAHKKSDAFYGGSFKRKGKKAGEFFGKFKDIELKSTASWS